MSNAYSFKYKCRLCKEVFLDGTTSHDMAVIILVRVSSGIGIEDLQGRIIGIVPSLIDTHTGCKKGIGIADLIGAEKENV